MRPLFQRLRPEAPTLDSTPPTATEPAKRAKARREILDAANQHRRRLDLDPNLKMRHPQRAVCICRRNRLVKPEVLVAAGYNATEGGR